MEEVLDFPEPQEVRLRPAGFRIRLGAYIVDLTLLTALYLLLEKYYPPGFYFEFVGVRVTLFTILINVAYFSLMECSPKQGSLGKIITGIKVTDLRGERISFWKALMRAITRYLSFALVFFGVLMIIWDKKKQGLHDKLAETRVYFIEDTVSNHTP